MTTRLRDSLFILGEHHRKGSSSAQLAFDLDLSVMEFNNFLNEGEPDSQPFGISKGFRFFLEMTREHFFQRLVRDSNPGVSDPEEDEFGILIEAHTDLSSLTVVLDRIGEKIVEELVELIFDPGDVCGFGRKLGFQLN